MAVTKTDEAPQGAPPNPPGPVNYVQAAPAIQRAEGIQVSGGQVAKAQSITERYAGQLSGLLGVPITPTSFQQGSAFFGPGQEGGAAYGMAGNVALRPGMPAGQHLILHELTHSFTYQAESHGPKWLVEGIADWAANQLGGQFQAKGGNVREGYQAAAGFIEDLEKKNPGAARLLAQALYDGSYSPRWFKETFGTSVAEAINSYGGDDLYPSEEELQQAGLDYDSYDDPKVYPKIMAVSYQMSPHAQQVAEVIGQYNTVRFAGQALVDPVSGEGMYSFADFVADVAFAVRQPPEYLEGLMHRAQIGGAPGVEQYMNPQQEVPVGTG